MEVVISFNDNLSGTPHIKINGKSISMLHDIHFDWNTKTSNKNTAARFSISYWEKQNECTPVLRTNEVYTSEMLGKNFA
ncbi:hypothetical protein LTY62_01890 [Limosilactobacillus balticus]|uniref:hypothetical protein n=1 Tax=Limosilactobacillus balticus TaxID=2759747 RepID=UPI001E2E8EC5|nr:hypothetical protein [Limosilactobacillus balticus]MCD7135997.1 hypothetical protein [Limosilactobacillus balticus]